MSIRKENDIMKLSDVSVTVGKKTYHAANVNWIQTPGEYPSIQVEALINPLNQVSSRSEAPYYTYYRSAPQATITNVIFNPPATIVFWSDHTKTVVKCDYDQEPYDPEKGIAMAIAKKTIGNNKYEYYNIFKHWLKKWDKQDKASQDDFNPTEFYI